MIRLTLYGRKDCHLCHEMLAVVQEVGKTVRVVLEEVDVDGDPALVAAHGDEVPVLCVNGRKAFAGQVDADTLRRRLLHEPDPRPD